MDNNKDTADVLISAIFINFLSAMIPGMVIFFSFTDGENIGMCFLIVLLVAFIGIVFGRIYVALLLLFSKPIDKVFKAELNAYIKKNAALVGSFWLVAPLTLLISVLAVLFSWLYSSMYE